MAIVIVTVVRIG